MCDPVTAIAGGSLFFGAMSAREGAKAAGQQAYAHQVRAQRAREDADENYRREKIEADRAQEQIEYDTEQIMRDAQQLYRDSADQMDLSQQYETQVEEVAASAHAASADRHRQFSDQFSQNMVAIAASGLSIDSFDAAMQENERRLGLDISRVNRSAQLEMGDLRYAALDAEESSIETRIAAEQTERNAARRARDGRYIRENLEFAAIDRDRIKRDADFADSQAEYIARSGRRSAYISIGRSVIGAAMHMPGGSGVYNKASASIKKGIT